MNYEDGRYRYVDPEGTLGRTGTRASPTPRVMLRCVTYDLRQDYLAMGYGEEATAEFDNPRTVEGLETALSASASRSSASAM